MSDTPKTDAAVYYESTEEDGKISCVPPDFARELERENAKLREALSKILEGGYAEGSDRAHPAIAVARDALDPKWRERSASHYPKP